MVSDNFMDVQSRLAPKKSNRSNAIQYRRVSGPEVLRRLSEPEKMSASLLGDYLKLGNSNASAGKLGRGQTRQSLKRIMACSIAKTEAKRKRTGPLYTPFSLITEGIKFKPTKF